MLVRVPKAGSIAGVTSVATIACLLFCWLTNVANAQRKYPSPEAPGVVEIADAAARYLENNNNGQIRHRAVAALALVEYYKRYQQEVPKNIPAINSTLADVVSMCNRRDDNIVANKEIYFPCVALILMLEVDAGKYKEEAKVILDVLAERQTEHGSYTYIAETRPDTSQSQFAALAMFVARQHNMPMDPEMPGRLLQFFVDYQAGNGSWSYRPQLGESSTRGGGLSIHSASASSVLLLADMLNLAPRVKNLAQGNVVNGERLPKNISIYIPPRGKDGRNSSVWNNAGEPLIEFDKGDLRNCINRAAGWYSNSFAMPNRVPIWTNYYMYALERYCYFREQSTGSVGTGLGTWYDQGVDYLFSTQQEDGSLPVRNPNGQMPPITSTGLGLLFLVRASEVISLPPQDVDQNGTLGIQPGNNIKQGDNGEIIKTDAEKSLSEVMAALSDEGVDAQALESVKAALKRSIREFRQSDNKDQGDVRAFLQTMLGAKNHLRRKIAITFLSGEQNMDNVPALIYALGDPNDEVALEAHNGLRLISRRFDEFKFVDTGDRERNLEQFQELKRQWTRWFLKIRPDARLLD